MPCYKPLHGYRSKTKNESGKRSIVFSPKLGYVDQPQDVPCGQCVGCRLERSRQWAIRCMHEAQLHDKNCFITLTYSDYHLPANGSLVKRDFQLFMKRLRKRFGTKIRFYHCGEYGEKHKRPHYHACLFGLDFEDKQLWSTRRGVRLYTSKTLLDLWENKGHVTIGEVTFESAAYVARYIMKKVNGDRAEDHYTSIDPTTGEIKTLTPEYTTMSRRPGIAREWFETYKSDVYPSDFLIHRNLKIKPPKYYDRLYEITEPTNYKHIKLNRKIKAKQNTDNTPERLQTKERLKLKSLQQLKRSYENG